MAQDGQARGATNAVRAPGSPGHSRAGDARALIAIASLLGLLVAAPAGAQGTRTLADWQRDLRHSSADVRVGAAQALGAFDRQAVAALTAALGDSEYKVRASAAAALVKIGPGPVVPGMIDAVRDSRESVRANAVVVLGSFGPAAKSAVPAIVGTLGDANPRVRELAIEALNRIESTGGGLSEAFLLKCH